MWPSLLCKGGRHGQALATNSSNSDDTINSAGSMEEGKIHSGAVNPRGHINEKKPDSGLSLFRLSTGGQDSSA